ncbi:MAG: hypothetical protein ACFBSE_00045 [Prochloraceae cyanobacterium]
MIILLNSRLSVVIATGSFILSRDDRYYRSVYSRHRKTLRQFSSRAIASFCGGILI